MNIRNIAIIAHVDHGKTTLVDKMLLAGKLFRDNKNAGELILDNNDLERERGITITSKNVSIEYKDCKINIIDTPGHSDFGGEVERVLNMADGCLLLVDAFEGPMPQTRFVLQKALQIGLLPIVVINKVDKTNCHPDEVQNAVFELMFNLDATEEQLNFPTIYGSAKNNWMSDDWKTPTDNITYLLDKIIEYIPAPKFIEGAPQMLVTSLDYSSYVGRIAVGKVHRGTFTDGQDIMLCKRDGSMTKQKIKQLNTFSGLGKTPVQSVGSGDICAMIGIEGFEIGALRVETTESADTWKVSGRGVLHLSILIETMRREGYELQVGQPQVIRKEIDGVVCEPVEQLTVNVPEEYSSKVIDIVTRRKGDLMSMETKKDRVYLEFNIPSRGIIGLRNNILTISAGEAVMAHRFLEYAPWKGDIERRNNGSIIAMESGTAFAYSIDKLQDRGRFFIFPQEEVYAGQVVGENAKEGDLIVNVTKSKKLTNMRASGSDDKVKLIPPVIFSLEEALEYIKADEYLEVTPKHLRIRKIILDETERRRAGNK